MVGVQLLGLRFEGLEGGREKKGEEKGRGCRRRVLFARRRVVVVVWRGRKRVEDDAVCMFGGVVCGERVRE
jgi:hypothetical protein